MGNLGSCDCDSKINRLQEQIDNMNSGGGGGGGSSSLQQQLDDFMVKTKQDIDNLSFYKQDKGTCLVAGGHYNFAIKNQHGHYYNIDYWDGNGGDPSWVGDGHTTDCNGNGKHRCVKIG